jgi:hypothetical protein
MGLFPADSVTLTVIVSYREAMKLTGVLVAGVLGAVSIAAPAAASVARPAVHHFVNCTDMHRIYKGGVAKRGAHDHRTDGGHARYAPHVSTKLYKANSQMDRDHDGVACEQ